MVKDTSVVGFYVEGRADRHLYSWLVKEDELPHFDVPRRHQPPALPLVLCHHDGDAVCDVPGPVGLLTFRPAVGDGVAFGTLGEFPLTSHSLVTSEALLTICHWLNEVLGHLSYYLNICKKMRCILGENYCGYRKEENKCV